jgi:hypothetical protein
MEAEAVMVRAVHAMPAELGKEEMGALAELAVAVELEGEAGMERMEEMAEPS